MQIRLTTVTNVLIVATCSTIWFPLSLPIGGLQLRASQLVLLPILLLLIPRASGRLTAFGAAAVLLGAVYVGMLLFWTAWWHETLPAVAAGRVGLHVFNLLHWAALQILLWRTGAVRQATRTLILTVACFNAYYLAVAFLSAAGITLPWQLLVEVEQMSFVGGALARESVQRFELGGVAAGCVSAACLVMLLALVMDRPTKRPEHWLTLTVLLGAGVVLGYSRQALVSLALGLFIVGAGFALRGRLKEMLLVSVRATAALVITATLLSVVPATRTYVNALAGRAALLVADDAYSTGTVSDRLRMWGPMWDDIAANPLMGRGQDAYLKYYPSATGGGAHNLPLEAWHAGGLIAFLAIVGLHVLAFLPVTARLIAGRLRDHCLSIAVVAGAAAIAAAALTNLTYWNPTYWVLLALVSAARMLPSHSAPPVPGPPAGASATG